jgi:tetratricopeptide (TPR) repeat protein
MRQWLANVAVIIRGLGRAGILVLAQVVLPGMRLYSAAEYVVNNWYSRSEPEQRERALAFIYERAGKVDQAEESLRRAVAMRSNAPDDYLFLGQFLARQKRPLDAIRAFEQAISVAQDSPTDLEFARRRIEELRHAT